MRERSRLEFPWALFVIVAALLALLVLDWAFSPAWNRRGNRDSFAPESTSQANGHVERVGPKKGAWLASYSFCLNYRKLENHRVKCFMEDGTWWR